MSSLSTLVAVVTGGGSGIGAACAAEFRARGARVGVLDLNPGEPADGLLPVKADVTDRASMRAAMTAVADAFGGIDILVNSAGIGAVGPVEGNDDAEWHHVLDVNVVGIARATSAALPYLRRSTHGAIVNLSFIAAYPVWSALMIAVDVIVIYAVVVHGRELAY